MTDRVVQVNTKQLQVIFQIVKQTQSWDSIGWHKYPTVPGHDPEKRGMIRIKNRQGVGRYIFDLQKTGNARAAQCDINIYCEGGYVPCHRTILMHFSPLLRDLISLNMKEYGIPTPDCPLFIAMKDFKLQHMVEALLLIYNGYTTFPISSTKPVVSILEFLKIQHNAEVEPVIKEEKKKLLLGHYMSNSESEDDEPNEPPKASSIESYDDEEDQTAVLGRNNQRKGIAKTNFQNKARTDVRIKEEPTTPPKKVKKPSTTYKNCQPSTSKAAMASNKRSRNELPKEDSSEYEPESEEPSNLENDIDSDSSSDIFVPHHQIKPKGKKRIHYDKSRSEEKNTSLAERVKIKARKKEVLKRYPKRIRNEVPKDVSEVIDEMDEDENSYIYKQSIDKEMPTRIEPSSSKSHPKAVETFKCYFCKNVFDSESGLLKHSNDECGKNLRGHYEFEGRLCHICRKDFPVFSHMGLIRHVDECYKIHQPKKKKQTNQSKSSQNKSSKPVNDLKVEAVIVGKPIVVIERLKDIQIARIIDSVNRGQKIDIPRLRGYNYLKVVPKKEIPDFYPDATREELEEQLRTFEEEQEESRRGHELRRQQKLQKPPSVPPLIINRERIIDEEVIESNAFEIYQKLKNCECGKTYENLTKALDCLKSHGYKRCWICCCTLRADSPVENHYRVNHSDVNRPGEVACPICKIPLKYLGLSRHMKSKHLNEITKLNSLAGSSKSILTNSTTPMITNETNSTTPMITNESQNVLGTTNDIVVEIEEENESRTNMETIAVRAVAEEISVIPSIIENMQNMLEKEIESQLNSTEVSQPKEPSAPVNICIDLMVPSTTIQNLSTPVPPATLNSQSDKTIRPLASTMVSSAPCSKQSIPNPLLKTSSNVIQPSNQPQIMIRPSQFQSQNRPPPRYMATIRSQNPRPPRPAQQLRTATIITSSNWGNSSQRQIPAGTPSIVSVPQSTLFNQGQGMMQTAASPSIQSPQGALQFFNPNINTNIDGNVFGGYNDTTSSNPGTLPFMNGNNPQSQTRMSYNLQGQQTMLPTLIPNQMQQQFIRPVATQQFSIALALSSSQSTPQSQNTNFYPRHLAPPQGTLAPAAGPTPRKTCERCHRHFVSDTMLDSHFC